VLYYLHEKQEPKAALLFGEGIERNKHLYVYVFILYIQ
jgi:hypothetical protein